jgi:hypothetical protein
VLDSGDKIHGSANAFDHPAGDHPVSEITKLEHLHSFEGHHALLVLGSSVTVCLPGVDQIRVFLTLTGERPRAKHAVFAL